MTKNQNIILTDIPFSIDERELFSKLRMDKGNEHAQQLKQLIEKVSPKIKPKAIYKVSYIESRNEDVVNIDGIEFTSRVLKTNDKPQHQGDAAGSVAVGRAHVGRREIVESVSHPRRICSRLCPHIAARSRTAASRRCLDRAD